jgi:serine phosphatase RsbU (regulator of sigma subunit)
MTIDAPVPRIEVRRGGRRVETIPLRADGTTVGRGEDAAVRLPDEAVSRRHAEFFRDGDDRWWVRDLGSVNGTWMNGQEITEAMLRPGDAVEIADYELRFHGPGSERRDRPSSHLQGATTTTYADLPVRDVRGAQISTLSDIGAPKIDTTHLATVNEFARRLGQMEDAAERLVELCRLMVSPTFNGLTAVALRLRRDEEGPPEIISPLEMRPAARGEEPHLSRSLLRTMRETGAPALAAHSSTDPGAVKMTMIGPRHEYVAAACPIRTTGDAIDVLYVTLPPQYGTGEWLTLIAHAAQTFEQIETAREAQRQLEAKVAYERELVRAAEIQRALVPRDFAVPGLALAIGFEPCRGVGGDYADVVPGTGGRALLAVADVCGKGLPAAIVASTVHSMVHACRRAKIELREMMVSLNEHLVRFLDDASFVTMVAMDVDPATGAFEMINAGHPAPVVVTAAGACRHLQSGENFPLGIMPAEYVVERGVIAPGELLSLFTDGLTEQSDAAGAMLGVEGVSALITDLRRGAGPMLDVDRLAARLTAFLDERQGDRAPDDDRTFLLAARG